MQRRDALVSQVCVVIRRPPAVVLIGGARGMGKSWLVDRVLAATGPGVVVGCRGLPAGRYVLVREVITAVVEAGGDRALAGRAISVIEDRHGLSCRSATPRATDSHVVVLATCQVEASSGYGGRFRVAPGSG